MAKTRSSGWSRIPLTSETAENPITAVMMTMCTVRVGHYSFFILLLDQRETKHPAIVPLLFIARKQSASTLCAKDHVVLFPLFLFQHATSLQKTELFARSYPDA